MNPDIETSADLPARKAAPVEYVKVCDAYGAGFFFIPGTDTCLKVGGYVRAEYQYTPGKSVYSTTGLAANPAMALHRENMIGRIRPGFCADLIAIPCSHGGDLFGEIVGFDEQVDSVVVNGKL